MFRGLKLSNKRKKEEMFWGKNINHLLALQLVTLLE